MEIILICGPVPNGTLDIGLWSLLPGVPFVISDIQDGAQEWTLFLCTHCFEIPSGLSANSPFAKCRRTNIWLHMM